jgi:asparagine synthase (glutamine-hydrolysing)
VLAHLYEDEGPGFVRHLRGMFAVAVWDGRNRRLVLARDPFGIKPLYYRLADGVLSFASELKALVRQPGFSREVDLDALEAFLAFNAIPSPLSIYREVRKLPAGHLLVWDGQAGEAGYTIERYARPGPAAQADLRKAGEEELAEELRARLRDSVRAHLVSDVPVGVLLSGGIDSSTLAALAAEESGYQVSTFTIGFEERGFDERGLARVLAERYGTDHHELVLRPNAAELLPRLAETFDEPFADSSAIPTYLVSQLARSKVKVALSGEGGDELFGGYATYVANWLAPRIAPLARSRGWLGPCSSCCRAPSGRRRGSSTRQSDSLAESICPRWNVTTPGDRCSRPLPGPSFSTRASAGRTTRSTSTGCGTRRPPEHSRSPGCRTSTSASTSSTTCS